MHLHASFLYQILKKKYPVTFTAGEQDTVVRSVLIYNGTEMKNFHLYLIHQSQLERIAGDCAEVVFLCLDNAKPRGNAEKKKMRQPVIWLSDQRNLAELQNAVTEILDRYHDWEAELNQCTYDLRGIREMLEVSHTLLGGPLVLADAYFNLAAYSRDYLATIEKEDQPDEGRSPSHIVDILLSDPDFFQMQSAEEPFLYQFEDFRRSGKDKYSLCCNLFRNGEKSYYARLMLLLNSAAYTSEQAYLLCVLRDRVNKIFSQISTFSLPIPAYEGLRDLIRSVLNGADPSRHMARSVLENVGWHMEDRYLAFCFSLSLRTGGNQIHEAVLQQLELLYPESCALIEEDRVFMIVNLTKSMGAEEHSDKLAIFLRENLLKAGISNMFHRFTELADGCHEAEIALELGEKTDAMFWSYSFSDYMVPYILQQSMEKLPQKNLCHRGLLKLQQYDEEHHTEYAHTLWTYIKCRYSSTHAAKELYIHRSTLLRHLEKIRELTGINLDDMETRFHLLYSFLTMLSQ